MHNPQTYNNPGDTTHTMLEEAFPTLNATNVSSEAIVPTGDYHEHSVTGHTVVIPHALSTVLITLISLLVVSGNVLNLVVLQRTEQIPAISRRCLLNLSSADLLVGVVSCLPCVYPAATGSWPYGAIWCQIAGITHGVSVTVSIWSLAVVSVDRYIAIVHALHYSKWVTVGRINTLLGCLWIMAFITFFIPLPTKSDFIYYQYSAVEIMCGLYWEYPWFCVVTAVYIPVLSGSILLFTSISITREVIILHKAKNTQIVPAQLSPTLPSTSSMAVDAVSTGQIAYNQDHRKKDSQGLSNININTSNGVIHFVPGDQTGTDEILELDDESPKCANADVEIMEISESNDQKSNINCGKIETEVNLRLPDEKQRTNYREVPIEQHVTPPREVQSRDLKAVKVLGVTASVYFIAWGPYVVLVVLLSFFPDIIVPDQIRFAFIWLANSNSFMNVFIYSLMYSGFRRNAIVLFRNICARILSWFGIQMQTVRLETCL